MNIGERIRKRREELGLTQEELAKKLGYKSRSSVNKVETARELSNKKVRQYAEILECSPAYLMGWESENELAQIELSIQEQQAYAIDILSSAFRRSEIEHFKNYIKLTPSYARKVDNYTEKLLSMQRMESEVELAAAHERTDIEVTEKDRLDDDEIMKDDSEWM